MTRYRVHVYREMRTTFEVEAESREAALQAALALPIAQGEIHDAEAIPTAFVVDHLRADGTVDFEVDSWDGDLDDHGRPTYTY